MQILMSFEDPAQPLRAQAEHSRHGLDLRKLAKGRRTSAMLTVTPPMVVVIVVRLSGWGPMLAAWVRSWTDPTMMSVGAGRARAWDTFQ